MEKLPRKVPTGQPNILNLLFQNFFNILFGGFTGGIGQVLESVASAFTGNGSWGLGPLLTIKNHANTVSNSIVNISAEQVAANTRLTDLETVTGTGIITPIWSSAGGKDLVSFPRVTMQPVAPSVTDSANGGDGDGSLGSNGIHSHNMPKVSPAFVQGHGFIDMAFVRGGLSAPVIPKVVKIITGADASWFDVTAWYLGIYVYSAADNGMLKVWDSGNLAGVLGSQRQAYNIGTGLTNTYIQPDHLVAVASLQIATGLGRRPRGLGCIFQTGIAEAAGTLPAAPHMYEGGHSSLPGGILMSSLTPDRDKIMWAAVGESS